MPGEILEVRVKPGDQVTKGQPMATLSAMKMEMVVSAPISGKISRIHVDKGMKVNGEDLLIDIE
ncbi:unnamed protein product [Protopolystoma xenopodis]|uniref:Lipoyl-binding domain-containing protein n=1 Tax=Protopolystoma xenopodis TaxID=117903 RepID=A0A448XLD0_9PLAT|nr:unnamed protein product [Protopolystoma xenopodis]